MRKIASNDELMTTRQAGEALGVAVRTVQLWVEAGVLPAWRTAGGHRRIARSAVEQLMAERALVIAHPTMKPHAGVETPRALKLLVVEHDPELRRLLALMVAGWDFPVELTTAANGFDGLVRIGELRPDMVVTDLNLRGMDAFQMVRSLKAPGSGLDDLAIVALSDLGTSDIKDRGGLPAGVAVFRKPVPFQEIQALARDQRLKLLQSRAAA